MSIKTASVVWGGAGSIIRDHNLAALAPEVDQLPSQAGQVRIDALSTCTEALADQTMSSKIRRLYRDDAKASHSLLSPGQREALLKPYLPSPPRKRQPIHPLARSPREFLLRQVHVFLYTVIQLVFSVYIRCRQTYHVMYDRTLALLYYHHRAPELIRQDVRDLDRLPRHLSIILELADGHRGQTGLETLMDQVAEVAAWTACVGIPLLSVYEATGVLKNYMPSLHRLVVAKMRAYEGEAAATLQVGTPHVSAFLSERDLHHNGDDSRVVR